MGWTEPERLVRTMMAGAWRAYASKLGARATALEGEVAQLRAEIVPLRARLERAELLLEEALSGPPATTPRTEKSP